jgi:tetratricopeptide (TPR) repeat protein
MPTINKPFLLKLVLVILTITGSLFGLHAIQAGRIPEALRIQANRAADASKTDQAIHYLRQYLEFTPDDIDAQIQLVELIKKRTTIGRSQSELIFLYDRILRLDPERHEIRRGALAACLENRRFSDAVTHAEVLLKAFPNEAGLWQQLGIAQSALHELTEARQSYEKAITYDPDEMAGYQRLAQLVWQNMNDPTSARNVLDRMVKALPQNPETYLIRARFETFLLDDTSSADRGKLVQAIADLQRVLELDPEHAEASLLLAELAQRERKIAAAHTILRDAVALYPRDLRLVRSLSWLELVRGNAPAAIAVLEDALKAKPDAFDLLIPLADLLAQQGDTTRTAEILRQLETRRAPPIQVRYLKARLAMRDGKWQEATSLLDAMRIEINNLPALETQLNLLLAVCAAQLGDSENEQKAYQRVITADPKNVQALVGLGNLQLTLGQFEDARRTLDQAAHSPYATGANIAQWARTETRRLRDRGASPEEWQKLEMAVSALSSRFGPVSSEPVMLIAEMKLTQWRTAEAVQYLRKEAARRPGDTRLWSMYASATTDLSGTAAGLAVVDEAQAACGDSAELRLARAKLYSREPGHVRPLTQLTELIDTWPEAEQLRLFSGMVEIYDHIGDQAGVVKMLRALASRRPTDVNVWIKLHERSLRTGDTKTATHARASLVKLENAMGTSVLLCDAATATTPAEATKVIDQMTGVLGSNPTRSDVCLALGRLFKISGNDTESAKMTERAFILEPTRYDATRAWLQHLCATGDDTRSQQLVNRLGTDPRWAGDPFKRVVGAVVPTVQTPGATKLLAWCRPYIERDPGGLGWLAETASAGHVFDPVPLLVEVTRRPSANVDDWLRLALCRKPEDLNGARSKVSPAAFFSAAAILVETQAGHDYVPEMANLTEKRMFTQSRLAVKLSRLKPTEATQVLEAYLSEKDLPKADAAWCRRNLAMLYAVGGTPEDRKRAMELLTSVDDGRNMSTEELRVTASVLTTLARYVEGADRITVLSRAAVSLNEAYKATNSLTDLFNLAQLYRSAGNRHECRKCLQVLLESEMKDRPPNDKTPRNIYYLMAALEELVENQEFKAAESFATLLLNDHPGEFRAMAAVARFQCKAGKPNEALALAEKYAQNADPSAGDHLTRSGRVAELLDELARLPNVRGTPVGRAMTDAAADRYAALVPSRAEAIVGVVGVLAADGRVDAAFAKLDQYGPYLPSRVRANAGLAIVRAASVSDAMAKKVVDWIDGCLAEEPDAPALLMSRAELFAIRQQFAEATADYEKVLAMEPRNVVALNNLAWILAADTRTAERALDLVAKATREVGLTGDLLDTRARVRITLKQFIEAERDLNDAIRLDSTPLRWFHLAVSRLGQSPPKDDDAAKAFREAKRRGLDQKGVHPADRATYDRLEAAMKSAG